MAMKKHRFWFLLVCILGPLVLPCSAAVGVRVLLGLSDSESQLWDGSVSVEGASLVSLEPWRFDGEDKFTGTASWQASTHRMRYFLNGITYPVVANGVIVWLRDESENTLLKFKTVQGDFSFSLRDVPFGKSEELLNDRVMVDRVPDSTRVTEDSNEQDYPSAATGKNSEVWIAYVDFKHNPEHDRLRVTYSAYPRDFSELAVPTGGDQVLVLKYSKGVWADPIAITSSGLDICGTAIAVDGAGRIWVFWAENRQGNVDIYAARPDQGKPFETLRISNAAGADVAPVATTDSRGRVWVGWQGWRNGKASIFVAKQEGEKFSDPFRVSQSQANEWNPAIAADEKGHVAFVWDSYRNGNYDIYSRVFGNETWGEEEPVATSPLYEAYPSAAYDDKGRLWIAYEEGAERWGKEFGSFNTEGVAVSEGRAIRLVAIDEAGNRFAPPAGLSHLLPGVPRHRVDWPGHQDDEEPLPLLFHFQHLTKTENDSPDWEKPHPEQALKRLPNIESQDIRGPRNSLPRLLTDKSGRLWLAFRSEHPVRWVPIGVTASEYIVSLDGETWTGPIFLAHSDNLIDNRPALVSIQPGELIIVGSSDKRRFFTPYNEDMHQFTLPNTRENEHVVPDPYDNDIYVQHAVLRPASLGLQVGSIMPSPLRNVDPHDSAEKTAVDRLRKYRVHNSKGELRILRGEFHRHSELSEDGGPDGTLIDQWRYMLDAAAMDWFGCCDHDNGEGREYSWWTTQKLVDRFYVPGTFVSIFSYERSVDYPEGHRNVLLGKRGIRPLPRLLFDRTNATVAISPDTRMLYDFLDRFDGIAAAHTSATWMGTNWPAINPVREPVVEIYQGIRQSYEMAGAPRANSENDSIGPYHPEGFVKEALDKGYRLGFEASSDHISTHMSYTCVYAKDATRQGILDGLKQRHVYAATDNILADVRSGDFMMGDEFSVSAAPRLKINLVGTAPFVEIDIIKDGQTVHSIRSKDSNVDFTWTDKDPQPQKASYYYVRGEQENGELVWTSPMWITYKARPISQK